MIAVGGPPSMREKIAGRYEAAGARFAAALFEATDLALEARDLLLVARGLGLRSDSLLLRQCLCRPAATRLVLQHWQP